MKVSCIQMNMKFSDPGWNYERAEQLISQAAEGADVLVLPETWNAGFFPHEQLEKYADENGRQTKERIGGLATLSSVLAWRIPGMAELGGLPSMGSHRVRHD